jgi:hypothetical protein
MGLHTEVTGLYNSDWDTIESSVWVNEETPLLKFVANGIHSLLTQEIILHLLLWEHVQLPVTPQRYIIPQPDNNG